MADNNKEELQQEEKKVDTAGITRSVSEWAGRRGAFILLNAQNGLTNPEIAQTLDCKVRTVQNHLSRIRNLPEDVRNYLTKTEFEKKTFEDVNKDVNNGMLDTLEQKDARYARGLIFGSFSIQNSVQAYLLQDQIDYQKQIANLAGMAIGAGLGAAGVARATSVVDGMVRDSNSQSIHDADAQQVAGMEQSRMRAADDASDVVQDRNAGSDIIDDIDEVGEKESATILDVPLGSVSKENHDGDEKATQEVSGAAEIETSEETTMTEEEKQPIEETIETEESPVEEMPQTEQTEETTQSINDSFIVEDEESDDDEKTVQSTEETTKTEETVQSTEETTKTEETVQSTEETTKTEEDTKSTAIRIDESNASQSKSVVDDDAKEFFKKNLYEEENREESVKETTTESSEERISDEGSTPKIIDPNGRQSQGDYDQFNNNGGDYQYGIDQRQNIDQFSYDDDQRQNIGQFSDDGDQRQNIGQFSDDIDQHQNIGQFSDDDDQRQNIGQFSDDIGQYQENIQSNTQNRFESPSESDNKNQNGNNKTGGGMPPSKHPSNGNMMIDGFAIDKEGILTINKNISAADVKALKEYLHANEGVLGSRMLPIHTLLLNPKDKSNPINIDKDVAEALRDLASYKEIEYVSGGFGFTDKEAADIFLEPVNNRRCFGGSADIYYKGANGMKVNAFQNKDISVSVNLDGTSFKEIDLDNMGRDAATVAVTGMGYGAIKENSSAKNPVNTNEDFRDWGRSGEKFHDTMEDPKAGRHSYVPVGELRDAFTFKTNNIADELEKNLQQLESTEVKIDLASDDMSDDNFTKPSLGEFAKREAIKNVWREIGLSSENDWLSDRELGERLEAALKTPVIREFDRDALCAELSKDETLDKAGITRDPALRGNIVAGLIKCVDELTQHKNNASYEPWRVEQLLKNNPKFEQVLSESGFANDIIDSTQNRTRKGLEALNTYAYARYSLDANEQNPKFEQLVARPSNAEVIAESNLRGRDSQIKKSMTGRKDVLLATTLLAELNQIFTKSSNPDIKNQVQQVLPMIKNYFDTQTEIMDYNQADRLMSDFLTYQNMDKAALGNCFFNNGNLSFNTGAFTGNKFDVINGNNMQEALFIKDASEVMEQLAFAMNAAKDKINSGDPNAKQYQAVYDQLNDLLEKNPETNKNLMKETVSQIAQYSDEIKQTFRDVYHANNANGGSFNEALFLKHLNMALEKPEDYLKLPDTETQGTKAAVITIVTDYREKLALLQSMSDQIAKINEGMHDAFMPKDEKGAEALDREDSSYQDFVNSLSSDGTSIPTTKDTQDFIPSNLESRMRDCKSSLLGNILMVGGALLGRNAFSGSSLDAVRQVPDNFVRQQYNNIQNNLGMVINSGANNLDKIAKIFNIPMMGDDKYNYEKTFAPTFNMLQSQGLSSSESKVIADIARMVSHMCASMQKDMELQEKWKDFSTFKADHTPIGAEINAEISKNNGNNAKVTQLKIDKVNFINSGMKNEGYGQFADKSPMSTFRADVHENTPAYTCANSYNTVNASKANGMPPDYVPTSKEYMKKAGHFLRGTIKGARNGIFNYMQAWDESYHQMNWAEAIINVIQFGIALALSVTGRCAYLAGQRNIKPKLNKLQAERQAAFAILGVHPKGLEIKWDHEKNDFSFNDENLAKNMGLSLSGLGHHTLKIDLAKATNGKMHGKKKVNLHVLRLKLRTGRMAAKTMERFQRQEAGVIEKSKKSIFKNVQNYGKEAERFHDTAPFSISNSGKNGNATGNAHTQPKKPGGGRLF